MVLLFGNIYSSKVVIMEEDTDVEVGVGVGVKKRAIRGKDVDR